MGTNQSKPCGATADVSELEYISALHQTQFNELRNDGSIHAIDIVSFLMSRYGMQVSEEDVKETILLDFGECPKLKENHSPRDVSDAIGTKEADSNSDVEASHKAIEHLDLTQVLALLLIPTLLKAALKLNGDGQVNRGSGTSRENDVLHRTSLDCSSSSFYSTKSHSESLIHSSRNENATRYCSKFHSARGDKHSPDSDLIENVLEMILHDATGNIKPQPLTKDLVRQLLSFYGELELSENDSFVEEMVVSASNDGEQFDFEGNPILLDKFSFARALTNDVKLYNTDYENRQTTNYYDVFETSPNERRNHTVASELVDNDYRKISTVFTFPSIDYTADNFRSKIFVVFLWVSWILSYFAYLFNQDILILGSLGCEEAIKNPFGCWLLQGIVNWLIIMAQLSVMGTVFILWASVGTGAHHKINPLWIVFGMSAIVLFTIYPYFKEFTVGQTESVAMVSTKKDNSLTGMMLYTLAFTCGVFLLLAKVLNLLQMSLPAKFWNTSALLRRLFIGGTIQMEAKFKKAANVKINRLVKNAFWVHRNSVVGSADSTSETTFGHGMLLYSKSAGRTEEFGGFIWTWKKIISEELWSEEGVWLTTHLLAGNLAQFTVCIILVPFFNEWFQFFSDYLGEDQKWRLNLPLLYGLIWELSIILIAVNYIPSSVRTILRYRSGGIRSLHDPKFLKLRLAVDQTTLLFGTIFWGTLSTSIIIGFSAFAFLAVCLWPEFNLAVVRFFANLLGLIITLFIKWIILVFMRRSQTRAFYRMKPAIANFVGIILESWNLGLTTQYIIFRTLRLLFAASIYIGRVDTPFITDSATYLGPLEVDNSPLIFRKDILAHEAHRHPYIERLGLMYMMKLKHGKKFGSQSGSCWRLLFTIALMPWMRKYRRSSDDLDISSFRFATMRMWTGRMPNAAQASDKIVALQDGLYSDNGDDEMTALKRTNEALQKKLANLEVENDMMRRVTQSRRASRRSHSMSLLEPLPNTSYYEA